MNYSFAPLVALCMFIFAAYFQTGFSNFEVALILHASADYIDDGIADQIKNWNGPVSLSIYFSDPIHQIRCINDLMSNLYNRSSQAKEYLSVHYVHKIIRKWNDTSVAAASCAGSNKPLDIRAQAAYPANILRNIAKIYHSSKYILIGDLDHLFSFDFENRMLQLAERLDISSRKIVLVYRLFEIDESEIDPVTKADLYDLIRANKANTFHANLSKHNPHYIDGEEEWLLKPENFNDTSVSTILEYTNPKWEPQFVAASSIPFHDENFPYRIRDNTCLRWELCRVGYQLSLVDDLFMFHRGIKRYASSAKDTARKIADINKKKFHEALGKFLRRMDETYPLTKEECPVCRYKNGRC